MLKQLQACQCRNCACSATPSRAGRAPRSATASRPRAANGSPRSDGDGQNDPADIPKLLAARAKADASVKLFAGWRVDRQDTGSKRWASKCANAIRSRLLRDETPDTGCGIKLFERAAVPRPAVLRPHAPLPAGAGAARRLASRSACRSTTASARTGVSKYNNLQPRLGRHLRPARRRLADQAQQDHRDRRDAER